MERTLELADSERRRRAANLRAGNGSAEQATTQALERAALVEDTLQSYLHLDHEGAEARARSLDERPDDERGSLFGLPVAIKDNIAARGWPSTSGSALLRNYRAPYDATVVERLRAADAVLLGTTNLDEFAMGSTTTRGYRGATRHPTDPERVPGGSSGGSAVAVASGAAYAALGTDTGGSVRQPAAHCGVFGIRPTYGRVSRFGITSYASSFDQVGCFASDLTDLGRVLSAISGRDPRDSTSANKKVPDFAAAAEEAKQPAAIVTCSEADLEPLDDASRTAFAEAVRRFEAAGTTVRRVPLPDADESVAAYYLLACAEASSNLARFDGMRYGAREAGAGALADAYRESRTLGFGTEVRRRIMAGATVLSRGYRDAIYLAATATRKRVAARLMEMFDEGELLLLPVTFAPPRRIAAAETPESEYSADRFGILAALGSLPAISLPAGQRSGLPFGVELMAPRWQEAALLSAAAAFGATELAN